MKRALATIQEIAALEPIEKADRIELASVMGWKVVVKKDTFSVGDRCVYFEVDSFLPIEERYEFLRPSSYRKDEILGEGFRVRSVKMRGKISQGLLFPIEQFPAFNELAVGTDVTDALNVIKFEMPEMNTGMGTAKGEIPSEITRTDELRVQSYDWIREKILGKEYYITTKLDGTSMTIRQKDGVLQVFGRKAEMKDDGLSVMWNTARSRGYLDAIQRYGKDITLQGELVGPKIQGNKLQLLDYRWYIFTMLDGEGNRVDFETLREISNQLNIPMVPIEEEGENFAYSTEELLDKATGKYPSGINKEGIVIRPKESLLDDSGNLNLSFKVLNNEFLLKTEA